MTTEGRATGRDLWQRARAFALRGRDRAVGDDRPAGEPPSRAAMHYELGRGDLTAGRLAPAIARFKQALRADRGFAPAAVALGDAHEAAGDRAQAIRVWERAAEVTSSLAILGRLERVYREDGRPRRMIALYQSASERAPGDLAVAAALGRVYFELEMLDAAADQFERLETRAPNVPAVHAFLGAVFERRGQTREAMEEYRRALRLGGAFSWPHRCNECRTETATWQDQCSRCGRWNVVRPIDGH